MEWTAEVCVPCFQSLERSSGGVHRQSCTAQCFAYGYGFSVSVTVKPLCSVDGAEREHRPPDG